jgi:hypothetical protein
VWRRVQLYFPFTLLAALGQALVRWRHLRGGGPSAVFIDARSDGERRARDLLLWRPPASPQGRACDLGLLLDPGADRPEADGLVSASIVGPGVGSIALYWDADRLARDRALWHRAAGPAGFEALSAVGPLERVAAGAFRAAPPALPPGALREAQTLLKRHARGGAAVCLNLDPSDEPLRQALLGALPTLKFVDVVGAGESGSANLLLIGDLGLTRHERWAIVGAADVYVGRFDELGAAALLARIPAALLGPEPAGAIPGLAVDGRTLGLAQRPAPDDVRRLVQFVEGRARAALSAPDAPAR